MSTIFHLFIVSFIILNRDVLCETKECNCKEPMYRIDGYTHVQRETMMDQFTGCRNISFRCEDPTGARTAAIINMDFPKGEAYEIPKDSLVFGSPNADYFAIHCDNTLGTWILDKDGKYRDDIYLIGCAYSKDSKGEVYYNRRA